VSIAVRRIRSSRETVDRLRTSLESTSGGLSALLESLERAGLRDALRPYRELHLVLVNQRLWCRAHGVDELDPLWREIAETAGRARVLLGPFADVLEGLERITTVAPLDTSRSAPAEPVAP